MGSATSSTQKLLLVTELCTPCFTLLAGLGAAAATPTLHALSVAPPPSFFDPAPWGQSWGCPWVPAVKGCHVTPPPSTPAHPLHRAGHSFYRHIQDGSTPLGKNAHQDPPSHPTKAPDARTPFPSLGTTTCVGAFKGGPTLKPPWPCEGPGWVPPCGGACQLGPLGCEKPPRR